MQDLELFMKKLHNYKENFEIKDYKFEDYESDFSKIAQMQKNKDLNAFTDYLSEKCKDRFFELSHPLYPRIKTRAVASFSIDMGYLLYNVVFFTDVSERYFWILTQTGSFADYFATPGCIYKVRGGWDCDFNLIAEFYEKNSHLFRYKDIEFGFSLEEKRPFHYFELKYCSFLHIDIKDKKIKPSKVFYLKKSLHKNYASRNDDLVYISPATIVFLFHGLYKRVGEYFKSIRLESLEDYQQIVPFDALNYDLTLWLGLPGERRAWLEQVEGTAQILKHLSKYFKKIKVYIDGMTGYETEKQDFAENKILFNKVLNATKKIFEQDLKAINNADFTSNISEISKLNLSAGGGI